MNHLMTFSCTFSIFIKIKIKSKKVSTENNKQSQNKVCVEIQPVFIHTVVSSTVVYIINVDVIHALKF